MALRQAILSRFSTKTDVVLRFEPTSPIQLFSSPKLSSPLHFNSYTSQADRETKFHVVIWPSHVCNITSCPKLIGSTRLVRYYLHSEQGLFRTWVTQDPGPWSRLDCLSFSCHDAENEPAHQFCFDGYLNHKIEI
jgi:hypothetical protein